ncbi:MAG: 50S ribosomal protein L17 [Thermoanaerobaculia bacterium]|nr:50S ribosomal protein L17 [Thermoanaerobaculia bacterium]
MQHNRAGRKLGRTTAHRKSLFRNQLSSLITHERIQTTLPKAKDLRPLIEKMVTLGKRGGLHARRLALKTIPEATTVKKLFEEIAPRFQSRAGGYTRILKLGRRPGDGAEMAILEFIDFDWAHRQAAKKVAAKAAEEKKASLLERAKKLVSGKSDADKATEKKAEGAEAEAATEKSEKKTKAPVERKKGYTAPKGPKGSGPRGGGSHGGGKIKTG